ncbi:hypothetical protein ACFSE1_10340 [Rhizobium helianthi]|uniref:DUF2188 domain-containing protein n=1 Tax=Rhizobium helianthi TaxID=1132695 RepID=A0ABW4M4G2_9HYPH
MSECANQRSNFRSSPRFTIGRDQHGYWVLQDEANRFGGLFASEEAALKYATLVSKDQRDIRRAPASAVVELMSGQNTLSRAA